MHPALAYIDRMINGPTCNCVRNAKVTKATKKALSIVQAEAKWRAEARKEGGRTLSVKTYYQKHRAKP